MYNPRIYVQHPILNKSQHSALGELIRIPCFQNLLVYRCGAETDIQIDISVVKIPTIIVIINIIIALICQIYAPPVDKLQMLIHSPPSHHRHYISDKPN